MTQGSGICPRLGLLAWLGKGSAPMGAGTGRGGRPARGDAVGNSRHRALTHHPRICPVFKDPLESHFDRFSEILLFVVPNQDINNWIAAAVDGSQQKADVKDKIGVDIEVEEDLDTEWDSKEEEEENSEEG